MKYIVFEYREQYLLTPAHYKRYELKNDKELKKFIFNHQNHLKNIEIFNKSNKCKINFEVYIKW